MYDVGCIGFYDFKAIKNPNLLKTALQYVQHFNGLIFLIHLKILFQFRFMKEIQVQCMV